MRKKRTTIKTYDEYLSAAEQGDAEAQYMVGCHFFAIGEYEEAIIWLTKSAKQEYAEAQFILGICYYKGEGVPKNNKKAFLLMQKSAYQGYPAAQTNLYYYYNEGTGVKKNPQKALEWLKKAAKQGDADAQFMLAERYYWGIGIAQDQATAVILLLKSSKQNNIDAQKLLAYSYETGNGIATDYEAAAKWYIKAARSGDCEALYNAARCYENEIGVPRDLQKAVRMYLKSAKKGDADAQYEIARHYHEGIVLQKDEKKSMLWLQMSAVQGHSQAEYYLALSYAQGDGIQQDIKKAFIWCKKAAKQHIPAAQCLLAEFYEDGIGIRKNPKRAFQWYQTSAQNGDVDAKSSLGRCYAFGIGIQKNLAKAKRWYEKATVDGDYIAKWALAKFYADGTGVAQDGKKALQLFSELLNDIKRDEYQDQLGAIFYDMATLFDDNFPACKGLYKDNFKAKEYYEKAIENDYSCESELNTLNIRLNINDAKSNRMGEFVKEIQSQNLPLNMRYSAVENRLKSEFNNVWNKLSQNTRNCLITGCLSYILFVEVGGESNQGIDFSTAISPMMKACEIEFGRIFLDHFLDYVKKHHISPTEFDYTTQHFVVCNQEQNELTQSSSRESDIYNYRDKNTKKRTYSYVSKDKVGVFTLGSIDKYAGICRKSIMENSTDFIKSHCTNGNQPVLNVSRNLKQKNVISVDPHFLAFFDEIFTKDAFPGADRTEQIKRYLFSFSKRVRDMTFRLRNPSSHTEVMPYWKALYCANMVIMVDRLLYDFVSKIKPEYLNI